MDREPNKFNLGCGEEIRLDFTNVDVRALPGIDIQADARYLDFVPDDTVDFVVAQHLLEYISRKDMVATLLEWKRILQHGGVLEIRVTDISELTKALYLKGVSREMGLGHEMVIALLYGQQTHDYDIRQSGFTSEYLEGILVGLGMDILNIVHEELDFILTAQKK